MSLLKWIGVSQPGNKQPVNEISFEGEDRYFGLENFGNTCYCNSVLQALYFCKPFRECVNNYPIRTPLISKYESCLAENLTEPGVDPTTSLKTKRKSSSNLNLATKPPSSSPSSNKSFSFSPEDYTTHQALNINDNLFTSLKDLFAKIEIQPKRLGTIAPSQFINRLKHENELFRGAQHQDAHEFLNFTLNAIAEHVVNMKKLEAESKSGVNGTPESTSSGMNGKDDKGSQTSTGTVPSSWVQQIFEGTLTNETRCLTCDTTTIKEESFLDLSIDIEENSSVSSCLRQFSANEMLRDRNKYFCDVCNGLQEAEKRMRVKKVPNVLALHLKRFKYQEKLQRYAKLSYRVVFPMDLRLFNTTNDSEDSDRLYSLFAIVVHIGSGLNHGHYVAVVKSGINWLLFDDDTVELIDEEDIAKFFGDLPGVGSGYVLFYEAVDMDMEALGLSSTLQDKPSQPLSYDSMPDLNLTYTVRNKPNSLSPPSYSLTTGTPIYPIPSTSSTSSVTNMSANGSSAGSNGNGWFPRPKSLKSKPSDLKIPKHEFFTNADDNKNKEPMSSKSTSITMAAWR